ncbi:MAG: ATP synthase F0 subunit B [Eubacterium sp.]|nr:ATP synthase F0 subunit B [Eubacterium sp.]
MPLGIDFTQILLHLFNVIILFGGLYYFLFGPVKKFMQQREDYYKKMDQEKTAALENAKKLQEEYDSRLQGAADEIAEKRQQAAKEISAMQESRLKEAQEEARKIVLKAEEEAARKRTEIVDEAREDITSLIDEAADKLLLDGSTESFYDAFLEDAERSVDHA